MEGKEPGMNSTPEWHGSVVCLWQKMSNAEYAFVPGIPGLLGPPFEGQAGHQRN